MDGEKKNTSLCTATRTGQGADSQPEALAVTLLYEERMSSAEAELMTALKASAEGVGVVQRAEEVQIRLTVAIIPDRSAAHGVGAFSKQLHENTVC